MPREVLFANLGRSKALPSALKDFQRVQWKIRSGECGVRSVERGVRSVENEECEEYLEIKSS